MALILFILLLNSIYGQYDKQLLINNCPKVMQNHNLNPSISKKTFTKMIIINKVLSIFVFYLTKIPFVFNFFQKFANENLIYEFQKQQIINFINGILLIIYLISIMVLTFETKGAFPIKIIIIIDGVLLIHTVINMHADMQWVYLISFVAFQSAGIIYLREANTIKKKKIVIEEPTIPILLF